MDLPQFTDNEPLYVYLKKLKTHVIAKTEPKYNLIVEFLNKAVKLKIKSLCDFRYIDLDKINKNMFKRSFDEYSEKLEKTLRIKFNFDEDMGEEGFDISDIISACVAAIGYTLCKKKVILRPKNKNSDSESSEERIVKKKTFLSIKLTGEGDRPYFAH